MHYNFCRVHKTLRVTPFSRLQVGGFHTVEGKRLQVNKSAERYQRELAYLVSVL